MKYDFGNAHLWHDMQAKLEPMRLARQRWRSKEELSRQLDVPLGSRISWEREDDPDDIMDLLFLGWPIYKVRTPDGGILYALPKAYRDRYLEDVLRNAPVGGHA